MTLISDRTAGSIAPANEAPPIAEPRVPALEFERLSIAYDTGGPGWARVVHEVSLHVPAGETVALVGQSGSGKSTTALAAAGLLPANGRIETGAVRIAGRDVTTLRSREWRTLRGSAIGYIPQDPLGSLDPVERVGRRVAFALRTHGQVPRERVRSATIELLAKVGIHDPERAARAFPHELSGGQLQRVLIATAIAGRPPLLIADEPTSALDVTVQKTILDLIAELQAELSLSVLFITHDLALAAERADRVVVLTEGRVVDDGPTADVLGAATSAYTRELFRNAPALAPDKYRLAEAIADTSARTRAGSDAPADSESAPTETVAVPAPAPAPVIEVAELVKRFPGSAVPAVDGVSFAVRPGSVHALVGESGSGKTTIGRMIAGLTPFDSGQVRIGDRQVGGRDGAGHRHARHVQLVYQNPLAALDPRFTVRRSLEEPLRIHRLGSARERSHRIGELADAVALPAALLDRRPRELSGGQRQRVAIARALALEPEILVLDEPTSALDVTVQAQIIDLLMRLRDEQGLTYLFISHDLSLVRQIADEVAVLEHGRLVEQGPAREVLTAPEHPYTQRLVDAIPKPGAAATA